MSEADFFLCCLFTGSLNRLDMGLHLDSKGGEVFFISFLNDVEFFYWFFKRSVDDKTPSFRCDFTILSR